MATKHVDIAETNGISASQLNELFRLAAQPGSHVNRETLQAYLEKRNPFDVKGDIIKKTALLRPVATQTVLARTKPFNLKRFYQNREGLYVWNAFEDRLDLRSMEKVASAPERTYVSLELKQNAYDRDIRAELPEHHLSALEDIAALIEAQWGGKKGFLFNDGRANIFYVKGKNGEVFVVSVSWRAGGREWRVGDWSLGEDGEWLAGRQVLCPSNAAL